MTPAWILDLLAAIMLVVAAVSAARLVAARPWRPGAVIVDTDIAHLLMAIAMAGVLSSSLATLPNGAWEVVFGLMIVWFAVRVGLDARVSGLRSLAGGHCAPHLVHSAAMLYMFLGVTTSAGPMAGMPGMSAASSPMLMLTDPTLAFAFALVLIGYSVWDLDQLSGRRYRLANATAALAPARPAVPALAVADQATSASASGSGAAGTPGASGGHSIAHDDAEIARGDADGGVLGQFLLSPAVTVGGRVTLGVVMTFMLLIAI